MSSLRAGLCVLVCFAGALVPVSSASAHACGYVSSHANGRYSAVKVTSVQKMSCAAARWVVRSCMGHRRLRGWRRNFISDLQSEMGMYTPEGLHRSILLDGAGGRVPLCFVGMETV